MGETIEIEVSIIMNCFTIKVRRDAHEIHLFALNKLKFGIVPALTNVLNRCIMHSIYSDVFKLAEVTLIYKDSDLSHSENLDLFHYFPLKVKFLSVCSIIALLVVLKISNSSHY